MHSIPGSVDVAEPNSSERTVPQTSTTQAPTSLTRSTKSVRPPASPSAAHSSSSPSIAITDNHQALSSTSPFGTISSTITTAVIHPTSSTAPDADPRSGTGADAPLIAASTLTLLFFILLTLLCWFKRKRSFAFAQLQASEWRYSDHQERSTTEKGTIAFNIPNSVWNTRIEAAITESRTTSFDRLATVHSEADERDIVNAEETDIAVLRKQLQWVQTEKSEIYREMTRMRKNMADISEQRASEDIQPPLYVEVVSTSETVRSNDRSDR